MTTYKKFVRVVLVLALAVLTVLLILAGRAYGQQPESLEQKLERMEKAIAVERQRIQNEFEKFKAEKTRLESELAAAKAALQAKSAPPVVVAPPRLPPVGIASRNEAVTTVTYRDARGVAFEGSQGWAKHEEKMADIDKKKAVGVEKAKNPTCGWGCMLLNPTPYPYGYGYGGYYESGAYAPQPYRHGPVTPYSSYGGGRVYGGGR